MFRHVTSHCLYAIRSGGALFYHRDITPFDVVFARIGLEVIGNFSATALSFYLFYMIGVIDWPLNPSLFLLGFFYMAWWSVSIAIIVAAWSERSDIVEHVWAPISYIYMPVSGFFYLAQWLPIPLRELALTVMPSLHCYEMIRGGLFGSRLQVFYDLSYLSFVLAMLTLFGLWMMRGVRQYIQFD
jgi:capsular polysaccharide transport system permease protein